jgi:hypothetical protein
MDDLSWTRIVYISGGKSSVGKQNAFYFTSAFMSILLKQSIIGERNSTINNLFYKSKSECINADGWVYIL